MESEDVTDVVVNTVLHSVYLPYTYYGPTAMDIAVVC